MIICYSDTQNVGVLPWCRRSESFITEVAIIVVVLQDKVEKLKPEKSNS